MRVLMFPSPDRLGSGESGIHTVARKYGQHMPAFGVEYVGENEQCDIIHVHAGMSNQYPTDVPVVSSLHGLYWTADHVAQRWEHAANASVVRSIRNATEITVPSEWVGETLARDMRVAPHVVPHGVDIGEWATDGSHDGYVVAYAKNRAGVDVSLPESATKLARAMPGVNFIATFFDGTPPPNTRATGVIAHDAMKRIVQRAAVYVSSVKETFGIGALEAMAAGVPVLTVNSGQVPHLVQHGVGGYCYRPNSMEDMLRGLEYCLRHRDTLGRNAAVLAREWTWEAAAAAMYGVYELALQRRPPTVDVVVPVYNKEPGYVGRAIESACNQTRKPGNIFVVDDGSDDGDGIAGLCSSLGGKYGSGGPAIHYLRQPNRGVAHARNLGVSHSTATYVCCLDADDAIEPDFLSVCVGALEEEPDVWLSYTKLRYINGDKTGTSKWPGEWDYDGFLRRKNQVPTCCVYRRELWLRLGGYKQRYAPRGAGSEDAEFFLRAGAYGYRGKLASTSPLFVYTMGKGATSEPGYSEVDWLSWHKPWLQGSHPFASYATPSNKIAHPVRQYDEPVVSVIIPVGPGHEEMVGKALDSLEAQTFLKWEAIVAWDSPNPIPERVARAYPYAIFVIRTEHTGAGAARNSGASEARGRLLLFLDADDWLLPDFLTRVLEVWNDTGYGVYTDYVGKAMVSDIDALAPQLRRNVLQYDGKEAVIGYQAANFDCEKAMRQPEQTPYIWGNITTLVPRSWHNEVGGFDESLPTWEDADYFWRMARLGKCFIRLPEALMVYRFYTGSRREIGLEVGAKLIKELGERYSQLGRAKMCGCKKTAAPKPAQTANQVFASSGGLQSMANVSDDSIVLVRYTHPNVGQHSVVGGATGRFYGYRGGGEQFLVDAQDIAAQPQYFQPIETGVAEYEDSEDEELVEPVKLEPEPAAEEAPEPAVEEEQDYSEDFDFTKEWPDPQSTYLDLSQLDLPKRTINALASRGVTSVERALELGYDGLTNIKFVGQVSAEAILEQAKKQAAAVAGG